MRLTPKERQQKIEERALAEHDLIERKKRIEFEERMIGSLHKHLAQLDRELSEPEDWVPGEASWFEYIKVDGAIDKAYTGLGVNPRTIAFNNFFQPGTGQAEAVASVAGAWLKIYKTALRLEIDGSQVLYLVHCRTPLFHNETEVRDKEFCRLCSSEIDTVRKWNTK